MLLPKDPNDDKNVIMEIRGAAGGDEVSGMTKTVAVDVWTLPCDSVAGTLWTRWEPLSYFNFE